MAANSPFRYHANAHVLSGYITRPMLRTIEAQASTALPATGGHSQSSTEQFRINDIVSFSHGYSYVSGSENVENGKTIHTTLVTADVQGLNILDVVTADRIVARLIFRYISGDEPQILVLGSRFENLRIAGQECKVELDHELGLRLSTFAAVRKEFAINVDSSKMVDDPSNPPKSRKNVEPHEVLRGSLLKRVLPSEIPGIVRHGYNGHILVLPEFGTIYLAELQFEHGRQTLTMLRVELGSPTGGHLVVDSVEAERRIEPTRPARYANAVLFDLATAQRLDSQSSLRPGNITRLSLDIGPLSPESQVSSAFPGAPVPAFPDEKLPADINLDVDVMVSSTDFAVAADINDIREAPTIAHGRFFLPGNGNRATTPEGGHHLSFYLRAPDQPGRARCRTGYYYRNVLVQSQLLVANVGQSGGFEIKTDFTLSDDLTNLENFPMRPRISIFTNANGDGTHQIILRKPGALSDPTTRGETFSVREKNIGDIMDDLRAILTQRAPIERRRRRADLMQDLIELAPKGWKLWTQLPGQHPHMFQPLLNDPAGHVVQVSRPTTSGFAFPWSLIYDIPLNTNKPAICALVKDWDGRKPLVTGSPRQCPHGPHRENVLCPFGFWGFRYSIEQLSSTKDSVFSIPAPDEWDFVVAETQYGIDIKALSNHVDQLRTTIRKRFPRAQIREGKNKSEVRGLLGHDIPIVYFYCHGKKAYDADPNTYLDVGKNEAFTATEFQGWLQTWLIENKLIWHNIRPLVFINACHSLEIHPETLVSYLDAFVGSARAAGVIGTEVRVSQDLAMKVAEQFFDLLLVQEKTVDGQSKSFNVDEALRTIRLDYLADGNLLGLVYTPYCWAELCVTRQTT